MKKSRFSYDKIVKTLSSVLGGITAREVFAGTGLCDRFCSNVSVQSDLNIQENLGKMES